MIIVGMCPETCASQLLKILYLFFHETFNFPYSLITNELYGFLSKYHVCALGSQLTNICICIDPTFMSREIILFVGFLRYLKDTIIVLHFLNNTIFLIISLWFRFFLIVILHVILNQSKVNGNKMLNNIKKAL